MSFYTHSSRRSPAQRNQCTEMGSFWYMTASVAEYRSTDLASNGSQQQSNIQVSRQNLTSHSSLPSFWGQVFPGNQLH